MSTCITGRSCSWWFSCGLLIFTVVQSSIAQTTTSEKPNIVVIVSDDQRYNTIRALGGKEVYTPNLDSLVSAGTTFTHAYNMGAWHGAVCVASRTMLMTGLPVWEAHRSERNLADLVPRSGFWSQQLRRVGYKTYLTGKWHVRADAKALFDVVVNERPGMPNQTPAGYNRPQSPTDNAWTPWDTSFEGYWQGGKHWSEVLADDATTFIDQARGEREPFFMYLAFNAPHDPRQAPKRFVDQYPLESITLPASYVDDYPFKEEIGSGLDLRDEQLAPFPRTTYAAKKQIQEYYASITHMDEQIGKILRRLAASGKAGNTYVFFVSDHGLAVGHHGLMGKQNMYDHSVRVPLIITGKNIQKASVRHEQVYLQDILPTTLELAGAPKPSHVFFKSLLPLIRKDQRSSYDEIYAGYMGTQRMVRTAQHKLIVYPLAEKVLLFDLVKDPDEMRDVAGDTRYAKVLSDMKERLLRQQKQLGDTLDLTPVLKQYPASFNRRTKAGWDVLFDGTDLSAWRSVKQDTLPSSGWVVRKGELSVLKGRTGGDIITRDSYADFELQLEFKLTNSANSGIKYLVNKLQNVQSKSYSFMGLEYQIIDDFNYPAVKETPDNDISTGSVYLLYEPKGKVLNPPGEWNSIRIVVKGKRGEHWLNGKKIAEFDRATSDFRRRVANTKFKDYPDYALADSGRILIQDHGDEVTYRNIRVKRLK